ncbi:MAG: DUF2339 domain-containing protein [Verrucomicrobia bacterium]|nr:DUF2339 domain-containing protein [Verrucomicrobiota bacterium]
MTFIVLCLVIAVVWLFTRLSALNEASTDMQDRLNQLARRLQEIQAAQKGAVETKPGTSAPPQPAPASVSPRPAEGVALARTPIVPPPPVGEPLLAASQIELPPSSEAIALEATPIAPVALELEAKSAPVSRPIPPPIPARPSVAPPLAPPSHAHLASAAPAPVPEKPAPAPTQSLELRVGTYWFVRAGVVMLLTGLVFLANLAYSKWVPLLGAPGKLALLYLASGALLGAGAWLQRKAAKESLNNFAQVLLAGGLGAVYFTTYAAHHYEPLRVVGSAALDGALLLAWAGFIVWLADRKKSETLALFALGLGYYTAVVTRVGTFTLCSNLVLSVATVFFLVRNRWAHLTLAGLVASYGGFAFWRFFHDGHWLLRAPVEELTLSAMFLAGYWACFTVATFLAQDGLLTDKRRAAFLSANNGAFFALVTLSMAAARDWQLWQFCLGLGAVLLGLAAFARTRLPQEPSVRAAYLTQGLLLVTLGLITKFSGQKLAVLLAAESVVLLMLGCRQPSRLLRAGAFVSATLAAGWFVLGWEAGQSVALGVGITGLLLFNACWMSRHEDPADTALLRARTTWLALLALVAGCATILQHVQPGHIAVWLMGTGLLLTVSVHVLRAREIALFAQGYLFLAHAFWLCAAGRWTSRPAWEPTVLLAGSLVVLHWWTRQSAVGERKLRETFETGYAFAVVALLYSWLHGRFTFEHWLLVSSALALVVTTYGALTRAWRLAAAGQIFSLVAAAGFARHLQAPHPEWAFALAPIAMLLVTATATRWAVARRPEWVGELRDVLQIVVAAYQWAAFAMVVGMVFRYVPVEHRPWSFAVLGGALFSLAGWRSAAQPLLASGLLLGLGLLTLLAPGGPDGTLFSVPNLLAVLLPLALQQVARRAPGRFPMPAHTHAAVLLLTGGFLWLHLSRWLLPERDGHFFTVAWSVLGPVFFAAGVWLRERTYFVLGLGCLLAALARVVTHDAWQPELFALNLLPMFAVLALQRVARKHPDGAALPDMAHMAAILVSGLSLWLFLSRWVVQASGGKFFLTASWAALALAVFAAGFALRERVYRWLGLAVLAGALGRVVLLDVWQLALVYRVLSFMALGIALIVLGYVYNRWQDKIREWL